MLMQCAQLIYEADKVYGISQVSRLSQVHVITRQHALQFVQEEVEGGDDPSE